MALSDSAEIMETVAKERFLRKSPFLEFCDAEGLPVITGYGVEDLRKVPLSHWERLGGRNSRLRVLSMPDYLRRPRKFSGHCSYVAVLNEKIRPHHEVHEGHEGFRIFQTPNFVIFVSFVVNIFLPIWLRRSRARPLW